MGKIMVSYADNSCFYHVIGDGNRYFDLDSLVRSHPEYKTFCEKHRTELKSMMLRQRELVGIKDMYDF